MSDATRCQAPARLVGAHGRAWRTRLPTPGAALAVWIVEADWARDGRAFLMAVCHLRPLDGVPDAAPRDPGATHEAVIYEIDPAWPIELDATPVLRAPGLLSSHFRATSDRAAIMTLGKAVRDVIHQRVGPGPEFAAHWLVRFRVGDAIDLASLPRPRLVPAASVLPGNEMVN
jgi:hypothetical protein